jgi:hypothetical protein
MKMKSFHMWTSLFCGFVELNARARIATVYLLGLGTLSEDIPLFNAKDGESASPWLDFPVCAVSFNPRPYSMAAKWAHP